MMYIQLTCLATSLMLIAGRMLGAGQPQTLGRYGPEHEPAPYGSSSYGYPPANYFDRMREIHSPAWWSTDGH